jgi:hypothetical protein
MSALDERYKRDEDGLYYAWDYPALSNLRDYPKGEWRELDDVRQLLNDKLLHPETTDRKAIFWAIVRWRGCERYRTICG